MVACYASPIVQDLSIGLTWVYDTSVAASIIEWKMLQLRYEREIIKLGWDSGRAPDQHGFWNERASKVSNSFRLVQDAN